MEPQEPLIRIGSVVEIGQWINCVVTQILQNKIVVRRGDNAYFVAHSVVEKALGLL